MQEKGGAKEWPRRKLRFGNPQFAGLAFGFGLRETNSALPFLPLATLFHEFDAFEALHHRAFTGCSAFTFERVVLGHKIRFRVEAEARSPEALWQG